MVNGDGMIRYSPEMWTATNESTTADATIESIRECALMLDSMGPVLVRFVANRGGFAVLHCHCKQTIDSSNPFGRWHGVPLVESDDYHDPGHPPRIVAVLRDSLTGTEMEQLVYGAAA